VDKGNRTIWTKKAHAVIGLQAEWSRQGLREAFDERAAIAYFDGQLSIEQAERLAYDELVETVKGTAS